MYGPPPQWLRAWKKFVNKMVHYLKHLTILMVRACNLGMLPRQCLQDYVLPELKVIGSRNQMTCQHPEYKRYGNATGRYAQCVACGRKWKWDVEMDNWLDFRGSQSSSTRSPPLPLPSSTSNLPKFKAKSKPRPRAEAPPDREQAMMSILNALAMEEASDTHEYEVMRQDIINNLDWYLNEYGHELTQAMRRGDIASQILRQQQVIREEQIEPDEIFEWESEDESSQF